MPFVEIFLIILGAVVVGIILSMGIIYLIRRFERPRYPPSKYIIPSPQTPAPLSKTNVAQTAPKNGKNGDKLEELLKNHKRVEPVGVKTWNTSLQPSTSKQPAPTPLEQPTSVVPSSGLRSSAVASLSMSQTATPVQHAKPVVRQPLEVAVSSTPQPSVVAPVSSPQPPVAAPKPIIEKLKVQPLRSAVYKELESSLNIATAPWSGKVTAFQTTAWDTSQDEIEPALVDKRAEITEVYIDIRLANNIVWVSNELGNKSPNLDETYRKLCAKIAERIRKIVAV